MADGETLFFLHVNTRKGEHSDTGIYYCLARNEVGKARSDNATLDVASKCFHTHTHNTIHLSTKIYFQNEKTLRNKTFKKLEKLIIIIIINRKPKKTKVENK